MPTVSEQLERDRLAHRLVARVAGMEMVARVVEREKPIWLTRIARNLVEIDDAVERATRANPGVDCLTLRLTSCRQPLEWSESRAVDSDSTLVRAIDHLTVRVDDVVSAHDVDAV